MRLLAVGALGLALAVPAQAQRTDDNEPVYYVFKRGDTLIELAERYFRKPGDYLVVQRLNRIANPRRIPIGKRVTIPFRLLKYLSSTASLAAYRGNVTINRSGQDIAPAQGLAVAEGSRLSTSARSYLTLQLEDGSRISMPSNSRIRIERLRHILLTDSVDYEIAVDRGRIRSKVAPLDREADRYRVRTPVAVSAVRGTDYETRLDGESGSAFTETVEGEVAVVAGQSLSAGEPVAVAAGQGAAASVTGELATATLLSPPELADPAKVQSDPELSFAVTPRTEATGHYVQVAGDAGFVDIVGDQNSPGNLVTLPGLPDGRYFAKIRSVAADGFEGMPATYAFKRQFATLGGSSEQGDFGYRFKWFGEGSGNRLYRFQLFHRDKTGVPIVDEAGLTVDALTMSELPDGDYYWRVGVTQFASAGSDGEILQKWTDFEKLTVAN